MSELILSIDTHAMETQYDCNVNSEKIMGRSDNLITSNCEMKIKKRSADADQATKHI